MCMYTYLYIYKYVFIYTLYIYMYICIIPETLMENLASRNETIVTLHANYLKGGNNNKMARMGDHGFWLVKPIEGPKNKQQNAKECIPFTPSAGSFNKSKS
jgi:deoxyxylulose-5-phosphate synthase